MGQDMISMAVQEINLIIAEINDALNYFDINDTYYAIRRIVLAAAYKRHMITHGDLLLVLNNDEEARQVRQIMDYLDKKEIGIGLDKTVKDIIDSVLSLFSNNQKVQKAGEKSIFAEEYTDAEEQIIWLVLQEIIDGKKTTVKK